MMKIRYHLVLFCTLSLMWSSCSKEEEPKSPTITILNIERHSAVISGTIPMDEDPEFQSCGIMYWSGTYEPSSDRRSVAAELDNGTFQIELTGLKGGTIYYAKVYVKSTTGTEYGEPIQFTTTKGVPEITIKRFMSGYYKAQADVGGGEIKEFGICRILAEGNEHVMPDIENSERIEIKQPINYNASNCSFEFSFGGIYPNYYYARLYIITTEGIGYSEREYYHVPYR